MFAKEKLGAEGLFDETHKRALPKHPQAIGVITSAQAAALKDVLTTLERRSPHIPVTVFPSLVQGMDAPPALIQALQSAYELAERGELDVLLLVRGGGSIEDLWAFNDEALARCIAQSPIPIVSGVGHETDFTIADFVADVRAPTPTGAAELITPDREALLQDLVTLSQKMNMRMTQRIDREAQRLDQLSLRLAHAIPNPEQMREKVQQLHARLNQAWGVQLSMYKQVHQSRKNHLELLNPQRTLERGYAVLIAQDGRAIRNPSQVKMGDIFDLHVAEGQAEVEFSEIRVKN